MQGQLLAWKIWQKILDCWCYSVAMIADHEERTAASLASQLAVLLLPPTLASSALAHAPTSECGTGLDLGYVVVEWWDCS